MEHRVGCSICRVPQCLCLPAVRPSIAIEAELSRHMDDTIRRHAERGGGSNTGKVGS